MNLITILGPTASGKSDLAADLTTNLLAKGRTCCIFNCDSRQFYTGMDLGVGKVGGVWEISAQSAIFIDQKVYNYRNIPHFLIDFLDPRKVSPATYGLINYLQDFQREVDEFKTKPDFLILVGGTGWYAKAIYGSDPIYLTKPEFLDNFDQLKLNLSDKNINNLGLIYGELVSQNTCFQKSLNSSDIQNLPRLINWILRETGLQEAWFEPFTPPKFEKKLIFATKITRAELEMRIVARIKARIKAGMLTEIESFLDLGEQQLAQFGLEYKLGWDYFHIHQSQDKYIDALQQETLKYVKKQLTWLKKQPQINWITSAAEIEKFCN